MENKQPIPIYVSQKPFEEKQHYVLIKDFNKLVPSQSENIIQFQNYAEQTSCKCRLSFNLISKQ